MVANQRFLAQNRLAEVTGKSWPHIALGQTAYKDLHVLSGLNCIIASATAAVLGPRSFWYKTPSWFTMKVMTPELPQLAG
jgi:hypothetical protein